MTTSSVESYLTPPQLKIKFENNPEFQQYINEISDWSNIVS
jgi:hypothetical protein